MVNSRRDMDVSDDKLQGSLESSNQQTTSRTLLGSECILQSSVNFFIGKDELDEAEIRSYSRC